MSQEECLNYLKTHKTGTAKEIADSLGLAKISVQKYLIKLKKWRYPVDFS